ncbi:TetR/AcrR family transcriptional regulator [Actinomadura sp. 1N219]|uniref:TetR/AcrR family transcriptional regulator n=1 Tax=Actinomadura sp. 1N219 TaxID=3375152 RepID=UPI0037A34A8A
MSGQPQRADARRNRDRILQAAFEAFAADGSLVPLDEIARRAGVGAGTVYRNFATKEALFKAVVTDRIERIIAEAHALIDADDDPAEALYGFLTWVVERAMFNHALCDALAMEMGAFDESGQDAEFTTALDALLRRAQSAGAVRPDVSVQDVRTLLVGAMLMERLRRRDGPPGRMASLACDALRPATKRNEIAARNETHCELCATSFTPAATGRPARFCSAACRQKAHRRAKTT